jgi:hypothetical protein
MIDNDIAVSFVFHSAILYLEQGLIFKASHIFSNVCSFGIGVLELNCIEPRK